MLTYDEKAILTFGAILFSAFIILEMYLLVRFLMIAPTGMKVWFVACTAACGILYACVKKIETPKKENG